MDLSAREKQIFHVQLFYMKRDCKLQLKLLLIIVPKIRVGPIINQWNLLSNIPSSSYLCLAHAPTILAVYKIHEAANRFGKKNGNSLHTPALKVARNIS